MTQPGFLHFPEIGSTNSEAMRRALAGEAGPLWISTDRQTAGRGRSGRSWESLSGNLHASLLMVLPSPAPRAYQLSLVAGLMVWEALAGVLVGAAAADLRLKWPNDILIGGRKAGGILIESTVLGAGTEAARLAAVIGIGINVATHPEDLGRPATSLAAHGAEISPGALLARLAEQARSWLALWDNGDGFPAIREAWLTRAHPIGERMSINTGSERVAGTFAGLEADGGLLLGTETGIRRFAFGDVTLAP